MRRVVFGWVVAVVVGSVGCKKTEGDKVIETIHEFASTACDCAFAACGRQVSADLATALFEQFAGATSSEEERAALAENLHNFFARDMELGLGHEKELSEELWRMFPGGVKLDGIKLQGAIKKLFVCNSGLK